MSVRLFKSLLCKSKKIRQEIKWALWSRRSRLSIKDRLQQLLDNYQAAVCGSILQLQPIRIKKMKTDGDSK